MLYCSYAFYLNCTFPIYIFSYTRHDFLEVSFNNVVKDGGAALFFPETALYMKGGYIAAGLDFPVMVVPERY